MTQECPPPILGVRPQLFASSPQAEQNRVMQIVRSIEPLSRRFPGINIDSDPGLSRPPLEHIAVPTLIISARDDLFNTLPAAEFAANTIPNAKLVVYERAAICWSGARRKCVRSSPISLPRNCTQALQAGDTGPVNCGGPSATKCRSLVSDPSNGRTAAIGAHAWRLAALLPNHSVPMPPGNPSR